MKQKMTNLFKQILDEVPISRKRLSKVRKTITNVISLVINMLKLEIPIPFQDRNNTLKKRSDRVNRNIIVLNGLDRKQAITFQTNFTPNPSHASSSPSRYSYYLAQLTLHAPILRAKSH